MLWFVLAVPFTFVTAIWLGRKFQRFWWDLDKPYAERLRILRERQKDRD